eukprot:gene30864-40172_t
MIQSPHSNEAALAVVNAFKQLLSQSSNMAIPVAAMSTLVQQIKLSKASTWMELESELRRAIQNLKLYASDQDLGGRTSISLGSGCDLFMKYVTRTFTLEDMEFGACKEELLRRGEAFAGMSMMLIHGNSRVVSALILKAAESKQFNVIVTEGKPTCDGLESAKIFSSAGIPIRVVLDSAVGALMEQVDLCLVGAEGVMENGGIANKIGTYQVALVAKALQKPFYVAAESYKFARMYPLSQRDAITAAAAATSTAVSVAKVSSTFGPAAEKLLQRSPQPDQPADRENLNKVSFELPAIDFTPANLITLLFTDQGVFTPAAVSDELIRLYQ